MPEERATITPRDYCTVRRPFLCLITRSDHVVNGLFVWQAASDL
jgi:hypothetical protein